MKTPDTIYLQLNDPITWCEDRVDETDIEYTKVARVRALEEDNEKLRAVAGAGRIVMDALKFEGDRVCPHGNGTESVASAWFCDTCLGDLQMALAVIPEPAPKTA